LGCALAVALPVGHRFFDEAACGALLRQQLRLVR
jgi:hypothetical protein